MNERSQFGGPTESKVSEEEREKNGNRAIQAQAQKTEVIAVQSLLWVESSSRAPTFLTFSILVFPSRKAHRIYMLMRCCVDCAIDNPFWTRVSHNPILVRLLISTSSAMKRTVMWAIQVLEWGLFRESHGLEHGMYACHFEVGKREWKSVQSPWFVRREYAVPLMLRWRNVGPFMHGRKRQGWQSTVWKVGCRLLCRGTSNHPICMTVCAMSSSNNGINNCRALCPYICPSEHSSCINWSQDARVNWIRRLYSL